MRRVVKERIAAAILLSVAALLLIIGGLRTHKIYDSSTEEFGLLSFTRISDADMVIDTTFSGIEKKKDRLYTTYDRSQPRGKRSCPT